MQAPSPNLLFRVPHRRSLRWLLALAIVGVASLLRLAVDPLLHDQIPYFIYVAAVAVASWFCGAGGGLLATVAAAFVGNYLFVSPRHQLIPHPEDWLAMALFTIVALGLVAFVGWARRAAGELWHLQRETAAVLDQMPIGVMVADAKGVIQFRNGAFDRILGVLSHPGQSLEDFREERAYRTLRLKDGREVATDERPMSRALRGETIQDEEVQLVLPGGSRRVVSTSAAPIVGENGQIEAGVLAITDTTDRVRIERELLRREEELRAATLAAEVGVWTWVPGSSSVSVGANWRGLFGVPPDAEVTFETWANALHPDDREQAVATLNAAARDHRQFSVEYRVVRPDGSVRWIIDRGRATYGASGEPTGMAGINVDISERKLAEEALRDANRLKDEFLATLSHELRTPLNAIVGWSDLLRRGDLSTKDAQRATESIYRNARVQSEMIADVLDVSRIISGKVALESRPLDVPALLRNALEAVRAGADAKGLRLAEEIETVPYRVAGDSTRVQQIFWNLLSNAVKFTAAGGTVRASLRVADGNLVASVSDTGIGIAPEFLPHVFERFRQHDSSITRQHGGLGLGLAIVKHLVELHGGTVQAESDGEGKGARFTVTLPAQPFEERRREGRRLIRSVPPVELVPDDVPSLCGIRVLIVDDERDAREVSASVLRQHGAMVAVAPTAAEGLDRFLPFDPHVLLIDLAMPEMDGYALIDRVRTSMGQKGARVPAIAFTAYARAEDRHRALTSGFQLHLAKPVDSHTLVRTVARVAAGDGEPGSRGSREPDAESRQRTDLL